MSAAAHPGIAPLCASGLARSYCNQIGPEEDLAKKAANSTCGNKPAQTLMEAQMTKSKRRTAGERSNRRKAKLKAKGRQLRARA